MNEISQDIQAYFKSPNDAAVVARLVEAGRAAFDAVLSYSGPYPDGLHPLDAWDDYLIALIGRIGTRWPELIRESIRQAEPGRRYALIVAAISSGDPQFVDLVLEHLGDRSCYVVDLVLREMQRCDFLKTNRAMPHLRKLLAGKRVNHLMTSRAAIVNLLTEIEGRQAKL